MGYSHDWEIEQEIIQEDFARKIADFRRLVLTLDDMDVRLSGPLGKSLPEIDASHQCCRGFAVRHGNSTHASHLPWRV